MLICGQLSYPYNMLWQIFVGSKIVNQINYRINENPCSITTTDVSQVTKNLFGIKLLYISPSGFCFFLVCVFGVVSSTFLSLFSSFLLSLCPKSDWIVDPDAISYWSLGDNKVWSAVWPSLFLVSSL